MHNIYIRLIIKHLASWLDRPEIIVITGSRQTGKTFFVQKILPELVQKEIQYYNFEDFELRELFINNPKQFLKSILNKEKITVFDEFQKAPQLTNLLKLQYDLDKSNFPKIILTGSSSLQIQDKISESLTGQSVIFHLDSLSFTEKYALAQEDLLSAGSSIDIEALEKKYFLQQNELGNKFEQYLLLGGYPELEELPDSLKQDKLKFIIQSILEKDLLSLVRAEHLFSAKKLLEILAYRVGNVISFENLASELQLDVRTVRKLTAILEGLFFIEFIYPKAGLGNEYKKAPKVYFHDVGIRNNLINLYQLPSDRSQLGGLVENFIFGQLRRYSNYEKAYKLNYWQNYNKNEVDFVLSRDSEIISIEVKYQKMNKPVLTPGIKSFIEHFQPKVHINVVLDYFGETEYNGCKIYYLPAYLFGLLI